MGDKSAIAWTEATWNPVTGCTRVSAGCDNCYAARMAATRLKDTDAYRGLAVQTPGGGYAFNGNIRLLPDRLDQPLRWRKPRRIFVTSMGDLFHEDVPDEYIWKVFGVMAASDRHQFQVLTKRPERMRALMSQDILGNTARANAWSQASYFRTISGGEPFPWPLPNVWLGVSVEDQATADERVPLLLETPVHPAAARWVSAEPLLGPVDFEHFMLPELEGSDWDHCIECDGRGDKVLCQDDLCYLQEECIHGDPPMPCKACAGTGEVSLATSPLDWIVVGGESGPHHRPLDHEWVRAIREQCRAAGVAYFGKQDSNYSAGLALPGELGDREYPA